jgi:hypothetical protein
MPAYRITYRGPQSLAVQAARLIADADGIELTSSEPPTLDDDPERVILALTVDAEPDAVTAAVDDVGSLLSPHATIDVEDT